MGWTCMQGTRQQVVDSCVREHGSDRRGFFILKRKWDGWNRLWLLCETRRPGEMEDEATQVSRFIMLVLLKSYPAHGEWCLKEVSDDMGPAETGAPLSWLDLVTIDRRDGYAYEWYARVREHHRKRGTGKKLEPRQSVTLINGKIATITSVTPLRCEVDGSPYYLKRKHIDWSAPSLG